MSERLLVVSTSPHIFTREDSKKIMWNTVLSLLPPMLGAIYFFGLRALLVILVSVISAVVSEALWLYLRRKPISMSIDGSQVITGILLALTLPPAIPLWMAALGSIIGILFGKQVFGGIGQNIFNPALIGRAFLMAAFPVELTTWTAPNPGIHLGFDAVTTATPLALMKFSHEFTSYKALFFGNTAGSLGETSVFLILIGFIFLLLKKYVDWKETLSYVGTVFVLGGIFWIINPSKYPDPLFHILSGGLMLGAVYMITDMVTSPVTSKGRIIYGIGAGILVVLIRLFGGFPEGVMYSILLMNMTRPWIDRLTIRRIFGEVKR